MGEHNYKFGHTVHHRIELVTSVVGPLYRCNNCGELYETVYFVSLFDKKMRICLDCNDKLNILGTTLEHLEEEHERHEPLEGYYKEGCNYVCKKCGESFSIDDVDWYYHDCKKGD